MSALKQYLTWFLFLLGVGSGASSMYFHMDAKMSALALQHAEQAQEHAEQANALLLAEIARTEELRAYLSDLETIHYKELTDAQETNDDLANKLRIATQRLSIRTTSPVHTDPLSCTGAGTGVDAAVIRADIHPEDAAAIIRLTGEADQCAITLTALQEWITQAQGK